MNYRPQSEGPEAATPRPSEPIAPHQNERTFMMPQRNDDDGDDCWSAVPVDSSAITVGRMPETALDRLFAAIEEKAE